jgi:hypothetical protein
LLGELEEAWHKNVFDQFLVDDLTHRVRQHLVTTAISAASSWAASIVLMPRRNAFASRSRPALP